MPEVDPQQVIDEALTTPKQMATAEGNITERTADELVKLTKEKERQQSANIPAPWGIRSAKLSPVKNIG